MTDTPAPPRIADLVPHAGKMCLLETIVHWDDSHVVASTSTHLDPANPLRRDGRLDSINLCEYGAQAMAVHGGLLAQREGRPARPGFLVSLRDVWVAGADAGAGATPLVVVARRVHGDPAGWQYDFEVSRDGQKLASGRATVALRDPA
jgi:predicted hotdog family 3-hydroxylacyl-ACP dehydratase